MSSFIVACAGLILLSGVFYLFPRRNSTPNLDDTDGANLEWYRLRQDELAQEEGDELQRDIDLRLLEDDAQAVSNVTSPESGKKFPSWIILPVIALFSSALYYKLGAAPDVMIDQQLQTLTETSPPEKLQEVIRAVETRSAQRPENLHYTALLGRFYMGQGDYNRAAQVYQQLASEHTDDPQALASAAQAEYLASGRVLSERAQMYAEQALAINPHQRTALGLLGMAAFEQQQYRPAIEYWQRLLAMEPAGSQSIAMISGVIEEAREKLVEAGGDASGLAVADTQNVIPAEVAVSSAGVSVVIRFPDGAQVNPQDTVFVLARGANSESRMPVAVQRLQAGQLPTTIRLDDSKSMAGQKLSEMESIVVIVQVSPEGRPGEANATWLGGAGPMKPSIDTQAVVIDLAPKS